MTPILTLKSNPNFSGIANMGHPRIDVLQFVPCAIPRRSSLGEWAESELTISCLCIFYEDTGSSSVGWCDAGDIGVGPFDDLQSKDGEYLVSAGA